MRGWIAGGWIDGWWMGRWIDGWVGRWVDEWMDRWVDGWMNGQTDGWIGGWMIKDKWRDRRTYVCVFGWMNEWMNREWIAQQVNGPLTIPTSGQIYGREEWSTYESKRNGWIGLWAKHLTLHLSFLTKIAHCLSTGTSWGLYDKGSTWKSLWPMIFHKWSQWWWN